MANASVNGVSLAWQQLGDGPDLVLVHGLAASRAFWFLHYAMPLSRRFRVTLFDLRGHGYSSRPDSGYDAVTMAGDLAGLLDELGIERCGLIGHSYGGSVALEYAGRHPERVTRLAIMDSKINALQAEQRLSDYPALSTFEKEVARHDTHDWDNEPQVGLRFIEVLARWRVEGGGQPRSRDAFTPFGEGRGALRAARQWLDLLDSTRAGDEFVLKGLSANDIAMIRLPTLLMYGERSGCLPSCRRLADLLPQAQTEIISGGGHFFPLSHPQAVMKKLSEFLDVPLAPASSARVGLGIR